jgi:hypothetical protein
VQQVLGGLKFDADNTLRETPVLDMVRTVGGMLERERATRMRPAASAGVLACLVEGLVLCTHHCALTTMLQTHRCTLTARVSLSDWQVR